MSRRPGGDVPAARSWSARVGDAIVLALVMALRVAALLGLGRAAAWGLAVLVGSVVRYRRADTEARLARAGVAAPERVAGEVYARLARGLVELLALDAAALARVRVSARGETTLDEIRREGRGAVVLTAHLANWDASACAVAARAPLTVVTKRLSNRRLDALWHRLRRGFGVELVPPEGALDAGARALAAGRLVAMMIDQAPGRAAGTVRAPFLGQDVLVDLAPALLGARRKARVVLAVARRVPGGQELDVLASWHPRTRAEAEAVTLEATRLLEAHVLAHPADWLWLHRREGRVPSLAAAAHDGREPRRAVAS